MRRNYERSHYGQSQVSSGAAVLTAIVAALAAAILLYSFFGQDDSIHRHPGAKSAPRSRQVN